MEALESPFIDSYVMCKVNAVDFGLYHVEPDREKMLSWKFVTHQLRDSKIGADEDDMFQRHNTVAQEDAYSL
jgi:hypothetical protein